jgi:hypothetical protein
MIQVLAAKNVPFMFPTSAKLYRCKHKARVNTKPEGDWTPANVGQHDSRPALEIQLSRTQATTKSTTWRFLFSPHADNQMYFS